MRFRLTKQDYIRLQTIAFFMPMLETTWEKKAAEDGNPKKNCFELPITICEREICAFKKLQQIFNDLKDLLEKIIFTIYKSSWANKKRQPLNWAKQ